ncbi:MAG: TetR/AcrR family transcriptional regulator [Calditrichia bacterium]
MPKIVDKEQKQSEIIMAAIRVFGREGVVKAKMAEVAREAGIGKGTIYEYFRSKEELFGACFDFLFQKTEQEALQKLGSILDPVKRLKALVLETSRIYIEEYGDFISIMMDFWAEGIRKKNDGILQTMDLPRLYEEFRQLISGIIEEGKAAGRIKESVDSLYLASSIIAVLDGLMLQWMLDPKLIAFLPAVDIFMDSLLNGICRE